MSETRPEKSLFQQIEPGIVLAGRYRILSSIGKGGMGFVYAAEEESLGIKRMVAIKVLPPQFMMDEGLLKRFREEIKIASALDHPNIVPIYSLGEHQGVYFYVMKLLDGVTAHQKLRRDGPIPEAELRRLLAPMARALHYAHTKGVIHRDVKSNNIHISLDGFPTLMDFGIARGAESSELTLPGQVVGTAEYMSPEQWYGEVDGRSDIYSLGIVLYELAAGQLPFRGKHTFELMKLHQEVPPSSPRSVAPRLSPALERLILKCLAKDPAARYQTALEVAEALESPYDPDEPSAVIATSVPAPEMTAEGAAVSGSYTMLQQSPVAELTGTDKKVWGLCAQADEAYARGEIDPAIKWIGKAAKLAPDSAQVATRRTKYIKMKELTAQILSRAQLKLADGHPQQAIADCENVLRCIPSPVAVARIAQARRQLAEAEKMVEKAQNLRSAGKIKAFTKMIAAAQRLNAELETPSGTAIRPRPNPVRAPRPVKKGPPILTPPRVIALTLFLALLILLLGVKPFLMGVANYRYAQDTPASLFLSHVSAFQLYQIANFMGFDPDVGAERLKIINQKAKSHYYQEANQAIGVNDLGRAVELLEQALRHDPTDIKLRDIHDMLLAKYQVQKSLGK